MNELQRKYHNWELNIKKTYPPVIKLLLKKLNGIDDNLTGQKLNKAISEAVEETYSNTLFLDTIEDRTVSATVGASQIGLGSQMSLNLALANPYYRTTQFANGINLQQTVWNGDSQRAVKKIVSEYLAFAGNTQGLSKKIGSKATSKAQLPKYLDDLIKLSKTTNQKGIEAQLKKAKRQIAKLSTGGYDRDRLKTVYDKVVKAVEAHSSKATLSKVVSNAFNHKVNSINARVARTEMARAYGMSIFRQIEEDKNIIGVRWMLSSAHPKPDECDYMAEVDSFGMGAGVSPRHALPPFPIHPGDLCSFVMVRFDPDNPMKNKRWSRDRTVSYLESITPKKRGQILGVKVSRGTHKEWIDKLESKGVNPKSKQHMTAKKVINELA